MLASAQLKSLDPPRRQHGELSLAARILPNGPKPRPWHSSSFAMEGWWTFMTLALFRLSRWLHAQQTESSESLIDG